MSIVPLSYDFSNTSVSNRQQTIAFSNSLGKFNKKLCKKPLIGSRKSNALIAGFGLLCSAAGILAHTAFSQGKGSINNGTKHFNKLI